MHMKGLSRPANTSTVSFAYCDMTAVEKSCHTRLIKCIGPSINKTVHIWTKCNAVTNSESMYIKICLILLLIHAST